jgi:O-methyltransferase
MPVAIVRKAPMAKREEGSDWPADAETMIGIKRLDNIQGCVASVIADDIPGDLIEAGVWRGGACIFMRAVLKAYADTTRTVWVADSFQGLPAPRADQYPSDRGDEHHEITSLAVPLDQVEANFAKYGLLDERVRFLPGWFKDTLPTAPIETLSVLRLDGDLYESTMEGLRSLYHKLSPGGYAIIDDYFNERLPAKKAVDDFRGEHAIEDPIERIDWTGAFWRRST